MSLLDEIAELRSRTGLALVASHDYYTYTKRLWRLLQQIVIEGRQFTFHNRATRTQVDEQILRRRAQTYVSEYLTSSTFQQFVSIFEDFFFALLRHWLVEYPGNLSDKQIEMSAVLKAPDKSAIILSAVDKELNKLKYGRLTDWFAYLRKLTKVRSPSAGDMERLSEIKASRDILVHNNGIANATYVAKSGKHARYQEGEKLEIPSKYHDESWQIVKRVVDNLCTALLAKVRRGSS